MDAAASHPISLPRLFGLAFAAFRARGAPMLLAAFLLSYLPTAAPALLAWPAEPTTTAEIVQPPPPTASRLTSDAQIVHHGHVGPWEMFVDTDALWLPLQFLCGVALSGALASLTISAAARDPRPWRSATRDTVANLLPLIAIGVIPAAASAAGALVFVPALMLLGLLAGIVVLALVAVPVMVLLAALAVAGPAQIAERAGVIRSLERSFSLTRGYRLVMLGVFAGWLFSFGAAEAIGILIPSKLGLVGPARLVTWPALAAVASLIYDVVVAALYLELRRAKEGVGVGELETVFA